jgi:hypothetical protein
MPGPSDALWRLRPLKEKRLGILTKRFLIGSVPEDGKKPFHSGATLLRTWSTGSTCQVARPT